MRRCVGTMGIRAVLGVGLALACLLGATGTAQTPGTGDLAIREISVRRVSVGEGDPAQGLADVDAIVGDLLHVRAVVVDNRDPARCTDCDPYERLRVDFYFTEIVTREHGLLGTQTVYLLAPGEQRLPAISVPTDGFTPGFYVFTAAIADPDAPGGDTGGTRYIVSYTQPETDQYWKVVADRGPRLAELQDLLDPFPSCQYGGVQKSFTLDARNVGTVPLSLSGVVVEVRPRFGDAVGQPLNVTYFPSGLGSPGNYEGKLLVTGIDTEPLERTVKPLPERLAHFEVLGRGNTTERLQLVVTVTPKSGELVGPQQEVTLPSQQEGAVVFSELDLWQHPQPAECVCEQSDDRTCFDVPTSSPAIRPVGYSTELLFHVSENAQTGEFRLHALDPRTGQSRDWHALSAVPLTDPVIRFEPGGEAGLFQYHAYVGTSSGTVEVYTLLVDKRQEPAEYRWVSGLGDAASTWQPAPGVIVTTPGTRPSSFLELAQVTSSTDGTVTHVLVVAGPQGIVVLDSTKGQLLHSVTTARINRKPAVVDEIVWYSVDRDLHGGSLAPAVGGSARTCTLQITQTIETSIAQYSQTLFWGDRQGSLHALDVRGGCAATVDADWRSFNLPELGPIVGLTIGVDGGIDGDVDPVVFATDVDGVIASIEYKLQERQFDRSTKRTSQGLRLNGEDDLAARPDVTVQGTVLTPARNGTSGAPVILPAMEPETAFLVALFDANSETDGKSGERWALVALNVGVNPFAVREVTNWGESVQFVLKLDNGVGPMLEPVVIGDSLLVVAVPGTRLYALNVETLK